MPVPIPIVKVVPPTPLKDVCDRSDKTKVPDMNHLREQDWLVYCGRQDLKLEPEAGYDTQQVSVPSMPNLDSMDSPSGSCSSGGTHVSAAVTWKTVEVDEPLWKDEVCDSAPVVEADDDFVSLCDIVVHTAAHGEQRPQQRTQTPRDSPMLTPASPADVHSSLPEAAQSLPLLSGELAPPLSSLPPPIPAKLDVIKHLRALLSDNGAHIVSTPTTAPPSSVPSSPSPLRNHKRRLISTPMPDQDASPVRNPAPSSIMHVNLTVGKTVARLMVLPGSTPASLSATFCKQHNVKPKTRSKIEARIRSAMEKRLTPSKG